MYRPPENSNRVKAIKSKFESNSNDSKGLAKAPLRKSKTLQDFSIKPAVSVNNNNNNNSNVPPVKEQKASYSRDTSNNNRANAPTTQASLCRQLSDPAKRNIKRTPAFRLDRSNVLAEKSCDQKNARLLHNRTRYLDGKISKFDGAAQNCDDEKNTNFKERLSRTKPNGFGQTKVIDKPKSNFNDIRSKFNGPVASKPNANAEIDKNTHDKEQISQQNETDASERLTNTVLKFLYSEPLPKSQRNKPDNIVYANAGPQLSEDIHSSTTLKLSESHSNKTDNGRHVSDDESHYSTKFTRNNPTYGSLRAKKSTEDLPVAKESSSLTDTLKNALRKPLPKGPAPKKPPRTFLHSPIKLDSPTDVAQLSLDKDFTKKLNTELQKNISTSGSAKKSKGDPKYMLDKLETALKSKKILLRRSGKAENTSEDDSDNERSKKLFNLRDLPSIPLTSSSQTLPNLPYTSPATSPKFNFNCLTSLGCVASAYEPVKESNSSFFVKCKEEPVYAEPFEYLVDAEEAAKNGHDNEGAIDAEEVVTSAKTIRRSLHYASSPVPDVKSGAANNHVSEVKSQDQIAGLSDSTGPSSASTSDMDSIVSTPSEENKTLIPGIKVKDLIKAIELNGSNRSLHSTVSKTNSSPGALKNKENGLSSSSDEDRVKKLETQLKNTLDRSFSTITSPISNAHSESNISETDLTEDDGEARQETAKFETYVKRVRSRIYYRPRRRKEHLFHCCLLVALDGCAPYVKDKFPPSVQEPYKIAELCFPEVENGPMDSSVKAQCYSLIITNEHGERTFGYCRRVLPEASTACLPLAYCILSKHRAPGFYRRVLEELEYRHGYPDKFRDAFMEELYNCKFPQPGETMIIDCSKIVSSAGCDQIRTGKTVPSENTNGDSDYSTKKSAHGVNMTKLYCDTKGGDYPNAEGVNGRTHKTSENGGDEESDLDLKSYVIVCNNGEYGTLIRGSKGSKNGLNVARGSSAVINIAHDIPPSNLKRSTSSPSLLADIELLPSELVLIRPQDSRHEENDLKLLGETLKTPVLQQVFCSLLLERKVIFVSCVLSKLSSCIEALQIILYPFSWQHTIIPVLPTSLWEIVDTPTPLVCGVLSAEVFNNFKIENAIVVDLDEGAVLLQVGDEDRILPWCLTQTLKDGLCLASKVTSNKIGAHNVFFSDAFLRVFIQCCGHYKDFIVEGEFQKSDFIQHGRQKGKRIRPFLKWFTETTMFYNFLEVALNDSSSLDLFDQRIKIYTSESATEILNKMKCWTNYKSFLSTNLNRFQ